MKERLVELINHNLSDLLLMISLTFIFIAIELFCLVLIVNLTVTMGFLGFLIAACLMLFVLFIYLFIMVSMYENL
uniref:Uncharacterized protein n=1 Tax=Siphoviridae sp. ctYBm1 TaxID=2826374 RepID=A0A8S5LS14_9CAUD|nr:MAG TPA: hypothetical protein [Siphoviridae sp. ctYBm1]